MSASTSGHWFVPARILSSCLLVGLVSASGVAAQTSDVAPERGVGFVGSSIFVGTTPSPADPAGYGLGTYYHGSLPPSLGLMASGGLMAGSHVSVGAETTWRHAETSILEQSRGHFEFFDIRSEYARTELSVSIVTRGHTRRRRGLTVEPVGGLAFCRDRRSLADRKGTYSYPPVGTIPMTLPRVARSSTRIGLVAGADGVSARSHADLIFGARVYWLKGYAEQGALPRIGNISLHFHAGFRWRG